MMIPLYCYFKLCQPWCFRNPNLHLISCIVQEQCFLISINNEMKKMADDFFFLCMYTDNRELISERRIILINMLGELSKGYRTISISPENMTGEKGRGGATPLEQGSARDAARDLGTGWKVNPYLHIKAGEIITLADVKDEGEICQIWLTPTGVWRGQVIRFYWDGADVPAVECPLGDFFACGLNEYAPIRSLPICVNPGSAFSCYWTMPFRKGFRIQAEG